MNRVSSGWRLKNQKTDERLQRQQLEAQKISTERLEKNLTIARQNLDDLNIRATIAGKLSGFDSEVGTKRYPRRSNRSD